jgi:uncharacterized protein with FMN-binding domain
MKRAPLLVLAGTVAGFAGVLTFHTRPVPATTPGGTGGTAGTAGTGAAAPPAAGPSRPVAGPTRTAPARGTGGSAGPNGVHSAIRNAEGITVNFSYGVLNVEVTVSGTRITNVSVPNLQTAEPTSQQISEQAIPMLRAEVLQAQSANVSGISGATFTSQAYLQSLHAALNKLNVP